LGGGGDSNKFQDRSGIVSLPFVPAPECSPHTRCSRRLSRLRKVVPRQRYP
jgi:hypothetical protein